MPPGAKNSWSVGSERVEASVEGIRGGRLPNDSDRGEKSADSGQVSGVRGQGLQQNQNSCTQWHALRVAFSSRKSHLAGSSRGHMNSGSALARPRKATTKT